ncbi:TlpA disulfide reductase family protein [Actinoplanes auranticolor]|uniref:Thioredoxin domain-containing protein n=1 Tax=Actinoplanes auranticolor TaxID=47988 RepID=A0A919VK02_9ACTN|nr:TlpA disulfide reductase family protein [Actinoplanes auranticolor]GIM65524.1 hypothetical protein Aau02nite_17760 [Actinoplanes auranticolor]
MSRVRGGRMPARWLTPPLALLLAACTATEAPPPTAAEDAASPFTDCAALTAPLFSSAPPSSATSASSAGTPKSAASASSAALPSAALPSAALPSAALPSAALPSAALPSVGPSGSAGPAVAGAAADLPDVSLPCFTGGSPVRLTALRGPAVINLWGSWCGPCREELPVMQALADATAGRLQVIGVDTRDSRDAGASFAASRGVSFPTLFDPDQQLLTALGKVALPVTVFVAADGSRELYTGEALDKPALGALVRTHTGVTVTG